MITDLEKKEIFKNMVFNKALYYESHTHKDLQLEKIISLTNDFENESDFINAVKKVIGFNNGSFLIDLQYFNRSELKEYYQIQFDLYKEKAPTNCLNWLNKTKKMISETKDMYGEEVDDTIIRGVFTNWYNETIKNISTKEPQQTDAVKPDEVKKEFKDFFNSDVKAKVIESIQNDFKDFKGKKMAYLIYLLHRDFKVIDYSLNSKTESRKHFVSILKGCDFRMTGIDKYFKNADVTLDGSETNDPDYFDIKEKLLNTIK